MSQPGTAAGSSTAEVSSIIPRRANNSPFLPGRPRPDAHEGSALDRNMRRERLTLDDLAEKARLSEIESLDEIKWAVLETNGDISFIQQPGS